MTNFEFYASEIKSRGFNFAVDKSNGELFSCKEEGSCDKCEFCPDKKGLLTGEVRFVCSKINIIRWLYQEHKIKMNALEYGLLKYMLSEGYEWVSRDDDFTIAFFTLKPVDKGGTWFSPEGGFDEPLSCVPLCEKLFEFLREDELFNIEELLKTAEVVNDD
ncbi:MAG: hypothetical protein ACLT0A_04135 [Holdemanella porci]|uniref:hypothetical protein n=1 Tax=Holdemanella porci TaxID=2652276 RepID=UPI0039965BC4